MISIKGTSTIMVSQYTDNIVEIKIQCINKQSCEELYNELSKANKQGKVTLIYETEGFKNV